MQQAQSYNFVCFVESFFERARKSEKDLLFKVNESTLDIDRDMNLMNRDFSLPLAPPLPLFFHFNQFLKSFFSMTFKSYNLMYFQVLLSVNFHFSALTFTLLLCALS